MNQQAYQVFFRKVARRCIAAGVVSFVCSVSSARAQMVAYKNGAGPVPKIEKSANGHDLIQIVTPNEAGLSHNKFDQFNVTANGIILNNSATIIQTQSGGYVSANPNLRAGQGAGVILNEVMSANRSYLNGYIEVAGQRAAVIVANPNGISVGNGAGFINASRAVLTTGTPVVSQVGQLSAFRVAQGDIAIEAGGMNATGVDQLDLIARSVTVNDNLWARQLNVITGSNQVEYASLGVGQTGRVGSAPQAGVDFGIDSSALGGMYAEKIMFVATDAGVGVRALGSISASAGDIRIDSRGKVSLGAHTSATGQINVRSDDDINNAGVVYAQQSVLLKTARQLDNSGTLASFGHLDINALSINSSGQLAAGVDGLGHVAQTGNLTLRAAGTISATGQNIAANNIELSASAIDLSASSSNAGGDVMLTAKAGDINHALAALYSAGSATFNASGAINNSHGQIGSARNLSLSADTLIGAGKVVAGQDATIRLQGDFTNAKDNLIGANRDLVFDTGGNFINQGDFVALRNLSLSAANVTNQEDALINAGYGTGRISAGAAVYNLGRIYGEDLAIGAASIQNGSLADVVGAAGIAGVIAARNSIALGADEISNAGHAVLQSLGNMTLGATLDANGQASGAARQVLNASATIDAGGDLHIQAASLQNTNAHFDTTLIADPLLSRHVKYYLIDGDATPYADGVDARLVFIGGVTRVQLVANGSLHANYTIFEYNETAQRTVVTQTDPARIVAGADMILSGNVLNDKSALLAGGTISGSLGAIDNRDAAAVLVTYRGGDGIDLNGRPVSYSQYHAAKSNCNNFGLHCEDVDDWKPRVAFAEAAPVAASLNIFTYAPNHLNNDAGGQRVDAGKTQTGSADPFSERYLQTVGTISNAIPNLALPDSRLFSVTPEPKANYVIETDPRFTNYALYLSSDFMLQQLGYDPGQIQKRLGDGFYEQKLINDQIAELTGKRFLGEYVSNEEQYRALMESGVRFAAQFQLTPGVALSASQMAELTSAMVWLVAQPVNLPDGSVKTVLVPVVYLARLDSGSLQPGGSVIAARNIDLTVKDHVLNGGAMQATQLALIHATDIVNSGAISSDASSGATLLVAENDIVNRGGTIAGKQVGLIAGRDVLMESTLAQSQSTSGTALHQMNSELSAINEVASVTADQLSMSSGRDMNLIAAQINSGSVAELVAGRDLNLASLTTRESRSMQFDDRNSLSLSQTHAAGTQIKAAGNLSLAAGQDINASAAYVHSAGNLLAQAGRDINLRTAQQESSYAQETYSSSSGLFYSDSTHTQDKQHGTQSVGSIFSGAAVQVAAANNIELSGSSLAGSNDVAVLAGNNITITGSQDQSERSYSRQQQTSGIFSSAAAGITFGNRSQSDALEESSVLNRGSLTGSVNGSVLLKAGNDLTISGSDVVAGQDGVLVGRNITVAAAENNLTHSESHEMHQSGITLSVGSPTVNAATSVLQSAGRASEVDDPRLKKLYAAKAAATVLTEADTISSEFRQLTNGGVGSISLNLSVGSSQSSSSSTSRISQAQGSQVLAGGSLSVIAGGAANDSAQGNISIAGSRLAAADTTLAADKDILLRSAQNSTANQSQNDSSGWSAGLGISLGEQTGLSLRASANAGQGTANGTSSTHMNSQISAGNTLTLFSGGNTTLEGAVVTARHISAEIKGSLTINSLQDTEDYQSRQNNSAAGASVTWGGGGSAGVSVNRSSITADYGSVTQQSGLVAGSLGYDINVGNLTALNGGILAGSAAPELNHLSTGSLAYTDITNHKQFASQSDGFSAETGGALYEVSKAVLGGLASNAGTAADGVSVTRATLGAGTVAINNGDRSALQTINREPDKASQSLLHDELEHLAQAVQNSSEAAQVAANIAGQFADQAHAVLFDPAKTDNQLYRVVCRQEPCTYDPAIQSDPNRRDRDGNPNVQLLHITEDDIKAMTPEQRANVVVATNGIMNSPQRAGELALQNADAINQKITGATGNSKPDIILVATPYSGNMISDLMAAGYEWAFRELGGYSNSDRNMAGTLRNAGLDTVTALAHSRGSLVLDHALEILRDEGLRSDGLKVQVKGPAISLGKITETTNQLRISDDTRVRNPVEYSAFPDDPVATFVGHAPNGNPFLSLLEFGNVIGKDNSAHGCYGTGVAGCEQIEKPYSYSGLNPAELQNLRQAQVDLWLSQGSYADPNLPVNPVNGLFSEPVYFQKNPVWRAGIIPVYALPVQDDLVNQLRNLQSRLSGQR